MARLSVTVSFTVHGKPEPAGSKRGFYRGGRVIVTDANPASRPWKALVSDAALQAMTWHGHEGTSGYLPPLQGPLSVGLTFYVTRPKGHYGTRGLRPSAPPHPTVKPDVLKLARGVEDALSGIVYSDDAQIVDEFLVKRYGDPQRVEITVRRLEDHQLDTAA